MDIVKLTNALNLYNYLDEVARRGPLELVKHLVENNGDIHHRDSLPLINAVMHNQYDIVKYLTSVGAYESAKDDKPFILACTSGHMDIIAHLVEIVDLSKCYHRAIVQSYRYQRLNVVEFLAKSCKERNITTTSVFTHMFRYNTVSYVKVLLDNNDVDISEYCGDIFNAAVRSKSYNIIDMFIERGINADC